MRTIEEQAQQGKEIARLLMLRRDRDHKGRWQTTWGNKTNLGIYNTVKRLGQMIIDEEEIKS